MWGWCELKYADGFTLVLDSGEWGPPYDRLEQQNNDEDYFLGKLSEADREKIENTPDLDPLRNFREAVRTRKPAGGNAAASHRVACIYHLANIAFRCGRPLEFDPDTDQIVGDEQANRLANQPLRAPWRI